MAVNVAFVLFAEPTPVNAESVTTHLQNLRPQLGEIPIEDQGGSDEPMVFNTKDGMVSYTHVPAAFPWEELEGPCATSRLWRDAEEELKPHQAHVIVAVVDELEPLESSKLLTQAAAALLEAHPNALGVYWGNATLIAPRNIFLDFTHKVLPDGPPLPIWVDIRVGPVTEATSTGFTHGLAALGHMELETERANEPFQELYARMEGLIYYVLEHGPVIKDKDTVGENANERIRVMYKESLYGHEGQVMRLEYFNESPSADTSPSNPSNANKKPWWKFW